MWLDTLSFLVSASSLALIRTSFNPGGGPPPPRLRLAVAEGLSYVLRHPVMGPVAAMAALFTFVGSPVGGQLVLFAKERLRASDAQLGLLYSAQSMGVIALSLAAGPLRKRFSFSQMIIGAMTLNGALIAVVALTPWYWSAVPLLGLRAGAMMLFNISVISLRQAIVPNAILGRVTSTLNVLVNAANPLGSLLGGLAIERTQSVALVYGAIGILQTLIALAFCFTPLGHAERFLAQPETAQKSG
jgi:predicted MFS family arabinose efflux permease